MQRTNDLGQGSTPVENDEQREKESTKETDMGQPRRLGKNLEILEPCSLGKGIFQEGLGINNIETGSKLRVESYISVPCP